MDNLGKIRRLHCTEQLYKLAQLSSLKSIRRKLKLTKDTLLKDKLLKVADVLWRARGGGGRGHKFAPHQTNVCKFLQLCETISSLFVTNFKVFFPLVLTDSLSSILSMSKVEKKSIALYVRVSLNGSGTSGKKTPTMLVQLWTGSAFLLES